MKTIGRATFPETPEEAKDWEAEVRYVALEPTVLVVARTRIEGKWAAYCKSVHGKNHDDEKWEVLIDGSKLVESIARAIFPEFKDVPYAR